MLFGRFYMIPRARYGYMHCTSFIRSLGCQGFPADIRKVVCVSACTQKTPNLLRRWFLKRRLTNNPRRHRVADHQLWSLYPHSPSLSSFDAAFVMLCCSASPVCSSTPLTAVCGLPEYQSVVKIMCIQTFCNNPNVLILSTRQTCIALKCRLELSDANAHLVGSPRSLSSSHPPTPPPSRWPALMTLPTLAKFQLVWRLISAVFFLPRWSETHVSAVSSMFEMLEI